LGCGFGLLGFAAAILNPVRIAHPRACAVSLTTQSGGTGGSRYHLAVMDQSAQKTPTRYVSFTTVNSIYRGTAAIFAGNILWQSLHIQVKVNYKGPAAASQTWTWYLYDGRRKNGQACNNTPASANTWKLLTFNPTCRVALSTAPPAKFVCCCFRTMPAETPGWIMNPFRWDTTLQPPHP